MALRCHSGGGWGPSKLKEVKRQGVTCIWPQLRKGGTSMKQLLKNLWRDDQGQDIAEYAVMLAVILVIVVGTIRLIGTNANTIFSETASSLK